MNGEDKALLCCGDCDETFADVTDLQNHITVHNEVREFTCPICSLNFRDAGTLGNHVVDSHSNRKVVKTKPRTVKGISTGVTQVKLELTNVSTEAKLVFDGPSVSQKTEPEDEIRTEADSGKITGWEIRSDGPGVSQSNCVNPIASGTQTASGMRLRLKKTSDRYISRSPTPELDESDKYVCHICSKEFDCKTSFTKHLSGHNRRRPESPRKRSKRKFDEDSYEFNTVEGLGGFLCPVCSDVFESPGELSSHIKTSHKRSNFNFGIRPPWHAEKEVSCDLCKKTFYNLGILKAHMMSHTDERNYSCHICAQTFKNAGNLGRHMALRHQLKAIPQRRGAGVVKKPKVYLPVNQEIGPDFPCFFNSESKTEETKSPEMEENKEFSEEKQVNIESSVVKQNASDKSDNFENVVFDMSASSSAVVEGQGHMDADETGSDCSDNLDMQLDLDCEVASEKPETTAESGNGETRARSRKSSNPQKYTQRSIEGTESSADTDLTLNADTFERTFHQVRELISKQPDAVDLGSTPPNAKKKPVDPKPGAWHGVKDRTFTCSICSRAFYNTSGLTIHMKTHSANRDVFQCKVCGKQFNNSGNLTAHSRIHNEKSLHCKLCGQSFRNPGNLGRHMNMSHREITAKIYKSLPMLLTDGEECEDVKSGDDESLPLCEICTEYYKPVKFATNICFHRCREEKLKELGQELGTNKQYACRVCLRVFNCKINVGRHVGTHSRTRQQQSTQCDVCQRVFTTYTSLVNHKSAVHLKELPYMCELCSKTFNRKSNLQTHMRTHTKEKTYMCSICGKWFAHSGALVVHTRRHTGERPFTCDVCGKAFVAASVLQRHMTVHSSVRSYSCKVCGKGFKTSSQLYTHNKIHSGERPHVCPTCGKTFVLNGSLKVHMKLHVREQVERELGMQSEYDSQIKNDDSDDDYDSEVDYDSYAEHGSDVEHDSNVEEDDEDDSTHSGSVVQDTAEQIEDMISQEEEEQGNGDEYMKDEEDDGMGLNMRREQVEAILQHMQ